MTDYRIDLTGRLPHGLVEEISTRFGTADIREVTEGMSIQIGGLDQPALRALLGLIWDVGAELRSITDETPTPGEPGDGVVRPHPDPDEGPQNGVEVTQSESRKP